MNNFLDHDDASHSRGDRELTLGTGTILGIFFGLVVLCGACFGGGYLMGHKSQPSTLALADSSPDAITGNSTAKPPAGSPVDSMSNSPAVVVAPVATAAPKPAPIVRRTPLPLKPLAGGEGTASPKAAELSKTPSVKVVVPSALLPSASPATPGFIMVQVAAVSHQEDADLLMGALRSRGYAVMARKGSGDPLIHVQVGPFNNKPAAEAMRQKLMGDGYNAMLKF